MKSTFLLFTILTLSISCLIGCSSKPPIEVIVEQESVETSKQTDEIKFVKRRQNPVKLQDKNSVATFWNTYKTNRINEGYSLMSVEASKSWLKANEIHVNNFDDVNISIDSGVKKIRVVKDDAGNPRVFTRTDKSKQ